MNSERSDQLRGKTQKRKKNAEELSVEQIKKGIRTYAQQTLRGGEKWKKKSL